MNPPIGKHKRYPTLSLTVIYAQERGKTKDRDPIDWKLVTDLPVTNRYEAIEKLEWHYMLLRGKRRNTWHSVAHILNGDRYEALKHRRLELGDENPYGVC